MPFQVSIQAVSFSTPFCIVFSSSAALTFVACEIKIIYLLTYLLLCGWLLYSAAIRVVPARLSVCPTKKLN